MSLMKPHLLIIGARPESLGSALEAAAKEWGAYEKVTTAGIAGETLKLDITNSQQIREVLALVVPDHIVCTVGVNEPAGINAGYLPSIMTDSFRTNVIGPMEVLRHWIDITKDLRMPAHVSKFVAISSNSARIPRTRSIPYCASKAALSMALRCAARELARQFKDAPLVWGYEPGLLDTSMTRKMFPTTDDGEGHIFPAEGPMHRMEGVDWRGLSPTPLADRIIGDLLMDTPAFNGTMIPFDGGEL